MISSYLEWLKIRDAVLADNHVELDIRKALSLAASCQHPDAIWLTEACRDKIVETEHELFEVCVALGDDDRAICFKWQLRGDEGCLEAELRRAAEVHNNAFAQALLARECEDQRKFELAKKSASQGERLGFLVLGQCFFDGEGCDENDEEATRNFLLAAKLGCVKGMIDFSEMLDSHDEKRWYWLSEAARNGLPSLFLSDFADEVEVVADVQCCLF
jgi:TPR repeat protein